MSEIHKSLIKIQSELKAAKNQRNDFGNYNYRSCEDIIEAVKPLLHGEGLVLLISDEIINVGNHNYIRAEATITNGDNQTSVVGIAREAENRKGMDDSQITGATSSYARKYALNGLFAIDDTKDADTMKPKEEEKASKTAIDIIIEFITSCETEKSLEAYYKKHTSFIKSLPPKERGKVMTEFTKHKNTIIGGK